MGQPKRAYSSRSSGVKTILPTGGKEVGKSTPSMTRTRRQALQRERTRGRREVSLMDAAEDKEGDEDENKTREKETIQELQTWAIRVLQQIRSK